MNRVQQIRGLLYISLALYAGIFLFVNKALADQSSGWYWYLGKGVGEDGFDSDDFTSESDGETIFVRSSIIPEPEVTENEDGLDRIDMEGFDSFGNVGEPVLPVKGVNVFVPPGKKIKDVEVLLGERRILSGTYVIEPGAHPLSLDREREYVAPTFNNAIYASDRPYPGERISKVATQLMDNCTIVSFNLYPVEFIPETGELAYYSGISLKVEMEDDPQPIARHRLTDFQLSKIKKKVVNPQDVSILSIGGVQSEALFGSYSLSGSALSTLMTGNSREYVIITNEYLKNTSGPPNFQSLIEQKIQDGMTACIVTTEWIYANYSGRRPDGQSDHATSIRNFIKDAHNNWDTNYVLLGGDAGDSLLNEGVIPVRYFYEEPWIGSPYTTYSMPSDLYFACLDGTMDENGNGVYGDKGDGQIDLTAEVYVGRAPVSTRKEVGNFVHKTLAYINSYSDYLTNSYQVGEYLGFSGITEFAKTSLEEMRLGSSRNGARTTGFLSKPQLELNTLYDYNSWTASLSGGTGWSKSEIISTINNGAHLINHLGHSDIDANLGLKTYDLGALTNTDYFFGYSQGCYPGAFDYDSIVENFVAGENGAFAFIANARYGWAMNNSTAGPSQLYAREFWDAVFGENITTLGEAHQDAKEDNIFYVNYECRRWCYLELNLFGDPALKLKVNLEDLIEPTPEEEPEYFEDEVAAAPGEGTAVTPADVAGIEPSQQPEAPAGPEPGLTPAEEYGAQEEPAPSANESNQAEQTPEEEDVEDGGDVKDEVKKEDEVKDKANDEPSDEVKEEKNSRFSWNPRKRRSFFQRRRFLDRQLEFFKNFFQSWF